MTIRHDFYRPRSLLSESAKTVKGEGALLAVQYMSPHTTAGLDDLCPWSTRYCRGPCLTLTSGRMPMPASRKAAVGRARWFLLDPASYWRQLATDIARLDRKGQRQETGAAYRGNGGSDIAWEEHPEWRSIMAAHPGVRPFDYTKSIDRAERSLSDPDWPEGYHLTLSWPGASEREGFALWQRFRAHLDNGGNVALVMDGPRPDWIWGYPTVDGDACDRRYLDPPGSIAVLSPKGALRRVKPSIWGFVMENQGTMEPVAC